jgi:retron-type reverse transcriptase
MQVERRGGGLRQRWRATRPYPERTLPVTTRLDRFTQKAREEPRMRFNALMGLVFDSEGLRESFERQDGKKAPGVDGMRKEQYAEGVEGRITELSERLRRTGYRPPPVRRVYLPKGDGRYRPLGIPCFEDRLVQDRLSPSVPS